MPQPRRLSPLDRVFLDLDTAETPQQVGWVIRFDGSPPSIDELRAYIAPRLEWLPHFTMRLSPSRRLFGGPRWEPDGEFLIDNHLVGVTVPPPAGDDDDLMSLVSDLLSQRLDRARPLWRLWLVDGLIEGWAIVGHGHHALIDGVAAIEVAALLLDPVDNPAPERRGTQQRCEARRGRRKGRPRQLWHGARMMILRGPRTALDHAGNGTRSFGLGSGDMLAIKALARGHGATTNDALLAAASRALTAELVGHHESPGWIKVLMPFQLRGDSNGRAAGNAISAVTIELPLGEIRAEQLFASIAQRTRDGKALGNTGVMAILARGAGVIPAVIRPAVTRWVYRRLHFNVIVSSLRGPQMPVGVLGRTATAIYPVVPITQGQGLSIGALSYRGRLWIGVNANAQLFDGTAIAQRIERGLSDG